MIERSLAGVELQAECWTVFPCPAIMLSDPADNSNFLRSLQTEFLGTNVYLWPCSWLVYSLRLKSKFPEGHLETGIGCFVVPKDVTPKVEDPKVDVKEPSKDQPKTKPSEVKEIPNLKNHLHVGRTVTLIELKKAILYSRNVNQK